MAFLVASSSILAVFLTILCFSATVKNEIAKKRQLEWLRTGSRYIDDELEKSFFQRYISPVLRKIPANFSKWASRNRKKFRKKNK